MKKLTIIFLVAVLVPSAILATLALKAQEDQEYVIERQRALLHQGTVDALSDEVAAYLAAQQGAFRDTVEQLLAERGVAELAANFDVGVRGLWPLAEIGFVIPPTGELVTPEVEDREQVGRFLSDYSDFIVGNRCIDLFAWNAGDAGYPYAGVERKMLAGVGSEEPGDGQAVDARGAVQNSFDLVLRRRGKSGQAFYTRKEKTRVEEASVRAREVVGGEVAEEVGVGEVTELVAPAAGAPLLAKRVGSERVVGGAVGRGEPEGRGHVAEAGSSAEVMEDAIVSRDEVGAPLLRNTMPMNQLPKKVKVVGAVSELTRRYEMFGTIVDESPLGAVARFVNGRLAVLFYYRPPGHPDHVFGAQVDLGLLREALADVVDVEFGSPDEICVALLDELGGVVARSLAGFEAEWRRPFVSTEINEVLPRWEVAAYLVNPGAIGEVAKLARLRLGMTVLAVLVAIGVGGLLIFLDYRRQHLEARQKTDFVSNVSHELKTPLTSIRMFSDLLGGEGAVDDGKRQRYAEVIQGEAGRLTRLINNVLDFSRLERGTREFEKREIGLVRLVRETVEHYRPGLEKAGFTVEVALSAAEAEISGDADALAQVLVNLLSNVEKYGGGASNEVRVELVVSGGGGKAEVRVCDRGGGVGRGVQRKIFERFFRVDDSLNCGIQGSGLGLTLARQIARAHGGDVSYRERDGGGSVFVLELPLAKRSGVVG